MPHALHFLVLALAGWVNHNQEDRIDYLLEENRVFRERHRTVGRTWAGLPYGATKRPRLVWLLAGRPLMVRVGRQSCRKQVGTPAA